jgi:hypothetical protein
VLKRTIRPVGIFTGPPSRDWVGILSANDRRAFNIYFQRGIYQILPGYVRQCRMKECALLSRRDIGNDDNRSGVQRFNAIALLPLWRPTVVSVEDE